MLSASITLHRRRKDGVGIKSADVVFALGDNNYAPPDDGEVWKSLVSDLILAAGKYLWSCTKVIKTNGDMAYTGKYCLGYSLDYADAVEMYYLSTSGTTIPDPTKVSFSLTYTTKKGYYLWTCVRYTSYGKVSYSTPRCNSYFPNDGTNGTSFTPKGEANEHFALSSEITDKTAGKVYLVDKNDTSTPVISAPCVVRLTQSSGETVIWNSKKAETGDAYMIGATLWVNNGSAWVQFGQIQGPAGEDGNALTLFVSPMKFTYTIDEDGNISNNDHTFYYMAFWGKTLLSENDPNLHFSVSYPDGCHFKSTNDNYYAHLYGAGSGIIKDAGVETTTYNLAGKDISAYYTSAYVILVATYKGFVVQGRIDMEGDMSLFNSDTIETKKEFIRKFESLETKQTEQGMQIVNNQSSIEQTANKLDFKVSQTQYDADYQKVSGQVSEIAQKADGISMRVEQVEDGLTHKAEISATVQKDADGNIESGVKINADQINLEASKGMHFKGGKIDIAADNFTLDSDGNMKANDAELNNATINGTMRSIYQTAEPGSGLSKADNIFLTSSSWFNFFNLKWDKTQIGRTIRIANYTEDSAIFNARGNKKFITINGMQVDQIGVAPMRCCVLHGLGYGDNFIAWCVEQSYTYKAVLPQYGMKYLAKGFVSVTGTIPSIEYQKTCNGSVGVSRIGQGYYRLFLPIEWSAAYKSGGSVLIYRIGVMLQGCGYSNDDSHKSAPIKATLKDIGWKDSAKSQICVDVWTSDNETANDGSFQFLIYNMDSSLDD